jgi:UDP-N-acetylmuramoyl-L-alanyl-D-glutamate--2,6-diaminopimelate ligase
LIQPSNNKLNMLKSAAAKDSPRVIADWLRAQLPSGAQLSADSRSVRVGDAFLAFPGLREDGRKYIAQALLNGAGAILWQREVFNWPHLDEAPHRSVSKLKSRAGAIAHEYYGQPSEQLEVIAVTGTNGKTSTTQWLAAGYQADGRKAAVIGTLGSGTYGVGTSKGDTSKGGTSNGLVSFGLTTPDAISLHRTLAQFRDQSVRHVALEASSIGLDQGRLDGARVVAAVFTNLTHDHLDYHGDMQSYAKAKALLFARPELQLAVVNGDDPASVVMLSALQGSATETISYGRSPGKHVTYGAKARRNLIAESIDAQVDGVRLRVGGDFGRATIELGVLGEFNALNILAVMATWMGLGLGFDRACELASKLLPVRGRMEKVLIHEQGIDHSIDHSLLDPLVVVDYAHTPDALDNALQSLRPIARARGGGLWCVFGAGGDRDPSKRPVMGRTVEALADHTVITSDNPRGESAYKIIADIRSGLSKEPRLSEVDRALAIKRVLREAQPSDVVLIAGKGHEEYQEIAGQRLPFSDVEIARSALLSRSGVLRV